MYNNKVEICGVDTSTLPVMKEKENEIPEETEENEVTEESEKSDEAENDAE